MRRREFSVHGAVTLAWSLLSGAASLPISARAQQQPTPVIGYLSGGSPESDNIPARLTSYRLGLNETGYVEGQNVAIEYRWADGQYERLAELAGIVRRGPRTARAPRVHAPRAG